MKRALLVIAGFFAAIYFLGNPASESPPVGAARASLTKPETYRLVHAIGNDETVVAKDLSKRDCDLRKKDNIAVAEALGIHNERLGVGSITCLPESLFRD